MSFRWLAWTLVATSLSTSAYAQQEQPSNAARLFDEGLADMQAKKFKSGCPALAESYRIEPLAGVLFTLAECERQWGKIASARDNYVAFLFLAKGMDAEQKKRQRERIAISERMVPKLAAKIPRLTISVAAGTPTAYTVALDGELIPVKRLGEAIEVDPGVHQVTLQVPGEKPVSRSVSVAPGESAQIAVALPNAAPAEPPQPPGEDESALRTAAYVTGGVGILGFMVGAVSGAVAIGRRSGIDENCVDLVCNEAGLSAADGVKVAGNVSTVGFVVGGIGLAAGVTLWILAIPKNPEPREMTSIFFTASGFGVRW